GEVAADDGWREAAALAAAVAGRRRGLLRQADDLERSRAVRQAADKAALLEAADEPVDARFGAQGERVLHLVKRRRHAGRGKRVVDVDQELVLLFRQHGVIPSSGTKPRTISSVLV